jgi:inorganic pyrophosphatase
MASGPKKKSGGASKSAGGRSAEELPAWDSASKRLHVLIDTPQGSPVKFKYDVEKGAYTISHVLPPGAVFPFDFGSIPGTLAEDGDPMDVRVLIEHPTFAGCLVLVRLIGVLAARQTQEGKTNRNDRLIGVAAESRAYRDLHELTDVPKHLLKEIEHFFVSYNDERGRRFKIFGRFGAARAEGLVKAGEKRHRREEALK